MQNEDDDTIVANPAANTCYDSLGINIYIANFANNGCLNEWMNGPLSPKSSEGSWSFLLCRIIVFLYLGDRSIHD